MKLEMVDVFLITADNTVRPILRGCNSISQPKSLARLMISMLSEQLRSYYLLRK